jgi:2-oxoglutarate ferredoxin oxidoreductase subunit beta
MMDEAELLIIDHYRTDEATWWCPGCGDFGVLAALQKALVELQVPPEGLAIVAGIGCSGKIGNYVNSYNVHVTHGRTLPAALGLKTANRELTVVAAGGDGDGYAIGMGHFVHALRRNPALAYIVMDDQISGLTKGQFSPTSDRGLRDTLVADGHGGGAIRPLMLALAAGRVLRGPGFSSHQRQLVRSSALVNVMSPCVTFNKVNTYAWFKQALSNVDDIPGYDPAHRSAAMELLLERDEMLTGTIYRDRNSRSFHSRLEGFRREGLARQGVTLQREHFEALLTQFE